MQQGIAEAWVSTGPTVFSQRLIAMKSVMPQRESQFVKNYSPKSTLFKLTCKALKYYLLMLFGLTISLILAGGIGVFPMIEPSLPVIAELLWRMAMILLCLGAIAVVFESIRS